MNTVVFVLKVLLLSAGLSLGIKYLAPGLNIPATPTNALIAVFAPTVVLVLLFTWKTWKQQ